VPGADADDFFLEGCLAPPRGGVCLAPIPADYFLWERGLAPPRSGVCLAPMPNDYFLGAVPGSAAQRRVPGTDADEYFLFLLYIIERWQRKKTLNT
jgi:hypothetical protein